MKALFISVCLIGVFGLAVPGAQAALISTDSVLASEPVSLLARLQQLLSELVRVQGLLQRHTQAVEPVLNKNLASKIYPDERKYVVENGLLIAHGNQAVPVVDRELFNLFVSVIGPHVVAQKVKEWRTFDDATEDVGGFVALDPGESQWVVGINRSGYTPGDTVQVASFVDLYMHEYAHIIEFDQIDFVAAFKGMFWTAEDYLHESAMSTLSGDERFKKLLTYYEKNNTRFVSDYATLTPGEDLAETFVSFVTTTKPTGMSVREQKVRTFYTNLLLSNERTRLRERVRQFGILQ